MSDVNQALIQLAKRRQSSLQDIEPVTVPVITSRPRWIWAAGGFLLSLAVGGWAVNSAEPIHSVSSATVVRSASDQVREYASSPTQKTTANTASVYSHHPSSTVKESTPHSAAQPTKMKSVHTARLPIPSEPNARSDVLTARTSGAETVPVNKLSSAHPEMTVQQVMLTPKQLANKAQERAEKALDSNEYDEAISEYQEALRYTPDDAKLRKALSALYYGKEDTYHAYQVLQEGINRAPQGVSLRLALARLLIQEGEIAAALTPLALMVDEPNVGYLSLRAALATRNKRYAMALASYQQLVQLQPNNARWWLGLGIQQERADHLDLAQHAYQQALSHVGISSDSIAFVHKRLQALKTLQGELHAN